MNKIEYPKHLRGVKMNTSFYRVLMELWNYSDANGMRAFPGVEQLARDCCLSVSTVKRALGCLEAEGWIRQESRGGRGRDGKGWASVYTLTAPTAQQLTREPMTDSQQLSGEPMTTGQQLKSDQSTAHLESVNSSSGVGQQLTGEPPSNPLPNPLSNPVPSETHSKDDLPKEPASPELEKENDQTTRPPFASKQSVPQGEPGLDICVIHEVPTCLCDCFADYAQKRYARADEQPPF